MRATPIHRTLRTALLCVSLASGVAATRPAQAQFGEAAGIGQAMQQDFLSRDIVFFAQGLDLDETQRVIVDALFADYEQAFDAGIEGMKKRIESMRDQMTSTDARRTITLVLAPFSEWSVEKAKLYDQFLQNVQVVLTPEQLEKWPAFERSLYREKYIGRGELSGESLNLFHVLRDMHLDEKTTQSIQPVVNEYDIALDEALRRRQNAIIDPKNPMLEALAEQDNQKGMQILNRILELRIAVRGVNDLYIERIASALPPELGAKFKADALDRAYPRVFRETQVQRMFRMAKELEGLDPTVLQSVVELEARYLSELAGINQQLHDAFRKHEPADIRQRAEDFGRRIEGQQVEPRVDPSRDMFTQRDDIARRYAKELQALLTPDQFAQLPGANRWVESPEEANVPQMQGDSGVQMETPAGKSPPAGKGRAPGDQGTRGVREDTGGG